MSMILRLKCLMFLCRLCNIYILFMLLYSSIIFADDKSGDSKEEKKDTGAILTLFTVSRSNTIGLPVNYNSTERIEEIAYRVNMHYEYNDVDVNTLLLLRAQEVGLDLTETVLMPPLDNMGDQIVEQLREERSRYREHVLTREREPRARTILIPVNLNNIHWVGLVVRLDEHDIVSRIQYIDPSGSILSEDFIPDEIRRSLRIVYGDRIYIENLALLRQTDEAACGVLTIENLIRAAQRLFDTEVVYEEQTRLLRGHHIYLLEQFRPDLQFNFRQENDTNEWGTQKIINLSLLAQFGDMQLYDSPVVGLLSLFSDVSAIPNIVMLGKSGAGKGTLSKELADKYGYTHVSVGDMCRTIAKEKTKLGIKLNRCFAKKTLLPNDVVFKLLDREIRNLVIEKKCFILDGFPRNTLQFACLCEIIDRYRLKNNLVVIVISISDGEAIRRLINRRICSMCARSYNLETFPPKNSNVCDKCGGALFIRADDNVEDAEKRMAFDKSDTMPTICLLEKELNVYIVNNILQLFKRYLGLLSY
ncbi:Adenylate kinase (modular protein) [Gammaproteobacteria bacterium]